MLERGILGLVACMDQSLLDQRFSRLRIVRTAKQDHRPRIIARSARPYSLQKPARLVDKCAFIIAIYFELYSYRHGRMRASGTCAGISSHSRFHF